MKAAFFEEFGGPFTVSRLDDPAVDDDGVALTTMEFDVLVMLARGAGTVVKRDDLYDRIMGVPYDGIDVVADSLGARRRIGALPHSAGLYPHLTARENIEFVMEVQGVAAEERRTRSSEILAEVGLEGLGDRRPAQMSGGQQQRVAVARAIASRPALVLADEPTANLDSHTAEQLMELFVELNEHHGTTFVIATHDQRVMRYAKRVVHMLDGKIVGDEQREAA